MTREALNRGRLKSTIYDSNREFITIHATICSDGTSLLAGLIYKGITGDLQSSWVDDFQPEDTAYFAATANGWTCNTLGVQWLEKVFNRYTKAKAGNRRRLLIVDGHSSYVNM